MDSQKNTGQVLLALDISLTLGLILECHWTLTEAAQTNVVTHRIEGLGNSKGNRIVDTMGRQAASFRHTGTRPSNNLTLIAVANLLKDIVIIKSSHGGLKQRSDMEIAKKAMTRHKIRNPNRNWSLQITKTSF